ncbi:hypothetical protein BS17DRAFT_767552 [Gyrodon lividus]|nr:hypothetical protein BS17DRAFT_767552 [Gyrodon lividus]
MSCIYWSTSLSGCLLHCGESRWNQQMLQGSDGHAKRVPAQTFMTIPLGPQLQAHNCSLDSAHAMHYPYERTQQILHEFRNTQSIPVIDDIAMSWDYLSAVLEGDITEHDIIVMVSLNGAQLYSSKEFDCWIYIWVILNLPLHQQYKKLHILPGGFIPGPNKPKNVDSFLFPGFHHLVAIQREECGILLPMSITYPTYICSLQLQMVLVSSTGMGWLATVGKTDVVFTAALLDGENIVVHTTIWPYYVHLTMLLVAETIQTSMYLNFP